MKKLFTLFFCSFIFLAQAQAPQSISYQGVARNATGTVLINQAIAVKFELHQGSTGGTIVFNEIHNVSTNSFGLFTLLIGSVNTTGFTSINWGSGPYFLEVSMDPTGGASFVSVGNQQLLSVPYALYAEKAGNASPTPTISINAPNTISNPSTGIYNITVPAVTSYTAGNGIDLTGNIITNTAPAVTPTLTVSGNNISINPGNTQTLPSYSLTQSVTNITLTQDGTSIATVSLAAGTTYSAGTDIDITGNVITNISPDQIVTITGTGVSGTYPNFSIATPTTTLVQGSNINLIQTGNTYTVAAVTPTLNVIGGSLAGAYPSQTLTVNNPTTSIVSLNNTILGVTQSGNSYTLAPTSQSLSTSASSITISNGNSVAWPTHSLSLTGNTLSINGPGTNSVTLPSNPTTTITQGANITVTGTAPNYIVSAPNYVLGATSNSITLTNGASTSSVAVPIQSLALTGTTLSAGPTTNSVNLATLPGNWTVNTGVIYPTALTNSVGIGTSGPLTDKMEINHPSSPTNTHLHLKQTGGDAFSRIKFTNAVAPTKYWLSSVTSDPSDANSGYNYFYHNGTTGRNLFTVAGNGKVSVNPFSVSYPTLFEVNGGIELDSTLAVNGLNNTPPTSGVNAGKIYYDRASNRFKVSENGGAYVNLLSSPSPWVYNPGVIYPLNNASTDKVAIGQAFANSMLDIMNSVTSTVTASPVVNIANSNPSFNGTGVLQINKTAGFGALLYATNSHSVGDGLSVNLSHASNGSNAIQVQQFGLGNGGYFEINNASSNAYAVQGKITNGTPSSTAVKGLNMSSGGNAGNFQIFNTSNSQSALFVTNDGLGNGGYFENTNSSNFSNAVYAQSNGGGVTISGNSYGTGGAAAFAVNNATSNATAMHVINNGTGHVGFFENSNSSNTGNVLYAKNVGTSDAIMGEHWGTSGSTLKLSSGNGTNTSPTIFAQKSGPGGVAFFENINTTTNANAVTAVTYGTGSTIFGNNQGTAGHAGHFNIPGGSTNTASALLASNIASGNALDAQSGIGYAVYATNSSSVNATVYGNNSGSGSAVYGMNNSNTTAAGYFYNTGSYDGVGAYSNGGRAVYAQSSSTSGYSGIEGIHYGNGNGLLLTKPAGSSGTVARFNNVEASNSSDAVWVTNSGTGHGLLVTKPGGVMAGNAARFENLSNANSADAVMVTNNGTGAAVHAVSGPTVSGSSNAALWVENGHIKTTFTANTTLSAGGSNIGGTTITRTPAAGFTCNDVSGVVDINFAPSVSIANGQYVEVRVTFQKAYTVKPKVFAICQVNNLNCYISSTSLTDCQIVIQNNGGATTALGKVTFNYFVIE